MKTKTQKAARRAVQTRRARNVLMDNYGSQTFDVLRLLVEGKDSHEVADFMWLTVGSVAAYKANLTRGTYDSVLPDCRF